LARPDLTRRAETGRYRSVIDPMEAILVRPVFQIAVVVRDLDAALRHYSRVLGSSSWRCYTFSAAIHSWCEYRGRPTSFSVRLALNDAKPQLELIEPVAGPSIHEDWLREHGQGLHHVGVVVDSLEAATARMRDAGYDVLQAGAGFGADGDGAYAYFDTQHDLGLIVEAVEPPSRMPKPERVWQP
jgi:catechol 2,3-dioxygenase-like lactoylglutathione lyase family enzyme